MSRYIRVKRVSRVCLTLTNTEISNVHRECDTFNNLDIESKRWLFIRLVTTSRRSSIHCWCSEYFEFKKPWSGFLITFLTVTHLHTSNLIHHCIYIYNLISRISLLLRQRLNHTMHDTYLFIIKMIFPWLFIFCKWTLVWYEFRCLTLMHVE